MGVVGGLVVRSCLTPTYWRRLPSKKLIQVTKRWVSGRRCPRVTSPRQEAWPREVGYLQPTESGHQIGANVIALSSMLVASRASSETSSVCTENLRPDVVVIESSKDIV